MNLDRLKAAVRDVPDFPKPGIMFKDIMPILADPKLFALSIEALAERHQNNPPDRIAPIESRGFLFGAAMATHLGVALAPIRKKGKLPWKTIEQSYDLEYGSATIEIHADAIKPGEKILLVDDVLATGGTAKAAIDLIHKLGGIVTEAEFLIELSFLNGRAKLGNTPVYAPPDLLTPRPPKAILRKQEKEG